MGHGVLGGGAAVGDAAGSLAVFDVRDAEVRRVVDRKADQYGDAYGLEDVHLPAVDVDGAHGGQHDAPYDKRGDGRDALLRVRFRVRVRVRVRVRFRVRVRVG